MKYDIGKTTLEKDGILFERVHENLYIGTKFDKTPRHPVPNEDIKSRATFIIQGMDFVEVRGKKLWELEIDPFQQKTWATLAIAAHFDDPECGLRYIAATDLNPFGSQTLPKLIEQLNYIRTFSEEEPVTLEELSEKYLDSEFA